MTGDLAAIVNEAKLVSEARRLNVPVWVLVTGAIPRLKAPWSATHNQLLRQELGRQPVERLAERLGRSIEEIDRQAVLLGLPLERLLAGRQVYSLPLVKHLLKVSGARLSAWRRRGLLRVMGQGISKEALYQLVAYPEVVTQLKAGQIADPALHEHFLRQLLRSGGQPPLPFTDREEKKLAAARALGLDMELMAEYLQRPLRDLLNHPSNQGLDPALILKQQNGRLLASWQRSDIEPLIGAIVRFEAGRADSRDLRWVGGLLVTWLDFHRLDCPPILRRSRITRAVEIMKERLLAAGFDPFLEAPPPLEIALDPTPPLQHSDGDYSWSKAEKTLIQAEWGFCKTEEIAARCTGLLRRLTGDETATRSPEAVLNYATRNQLNGAQRWDYGLTVTEAARLSGYSQYFLWDEVFRSKQLPIKGKGKYRYIAWVDWFTWLRQRRQYDQRLAEARAAIGEPTISKTEAMALIGISESHITRYLQAGILKGWKLPVGQRGVWRVSLADAERVKVERDGGQLRLDTLAYGQVRQKTVESLRKLYKRGYQTRDREYSAWSPGNLTVHGVATLSGVDSRQIIQDIKAAILPAIQRIQGGGRVIYAVTPADAEAYAARPRPGRAGKLQAARQRHLEQIRAQGLLTAEEVAEQFGVKPGTVIAWNNQGKISYRLIGRRAAYDPAEVERFRRERAK